MQTIYNIQELGMLTAIRQEWVKRIDDNIFEIRSRVSTNIQRVLYFQKINQNYIITHGFTKKTQKTPIEQIQKAYKIMQEYKESNNEED
jgi:phage-related protein